MSIQSMTGFARADGASPGYRWHWELRSVNNRGLDVRMRLPPGFESLEPRVREAVTKRFSRGSLNITLSVAREGAASQLRVNEAVLAEIVQAVERIRAALGSPPPRAELLLGLKGVLESAEETETPAALAARHEAVMATFAEAMDALAIARGAEGTRLAVVLTGQASEVARLVAEIAASPARRPEAIRGRIAEQVARLVETGQPLDPLRLHQEAVLIATRADVAEELDRLGAHLAALRGLLGETGAVGRKLDFLAQEFNREANTLTSKAGDAETARLGLALKVVIDQMREQVQNIE